MVSTVVQGPQNLLSSFPLGKLQTKYTGGNSEVSDTDSENVLSLHKKVSGTFFWARSRIGIRIVCLSAHQKKMSVTFF